MAKKTALLGMLVALAFVLSYIETLIPVNLGIPGAKLGLANLVVMVALYTLGTKEAFALSMVRILLTGLTFSSMTFEFCSDVSGKEIKAFFSCRSERSRRHFAQCRSNTRGNVGT